jgi:hypothetical protein
MGPVAARLLTVGELVERLTRLAATLPRGLDIPVEAGLATVDETDTSAAITVQAGGGMWPQCGCKLATVEIIGDRGHPDATRYAYHPTVGHLEKRVEATRRSDYRQPRATSYRAWELCSAVAPTGCPSCRYQTRPVRRACKAACARRQT